MEMQNKLKKKADPEEFTMDSTTDSDSGSEESTYGERIAESQVFSSVNNT